MGLIATFFRPAQPIPEDCRSTFKHLYGDIAWFGLLNGSTLAFTAIYAARLGASIHMLGLLSAAPAIVSLVFALPAGKWIEKNAHGAPIFWAAVVGRLFYLVFVPIAWMTNQPLQVWVILIITFVMNVPITGLNIGFNVMFGDVVPMEWRAYVAGLRNSLLALTTVVTTLVCGEILVRVKFVPAYQVVFLIGFIGAVMSTYHLWYLRTKSHRDDPAPLAVDPIDPDAEVQLVSTSVETLRPTSAPGFFRRMWQSLPFRADLIRGTFGKILGLLFFFHLAQYLAIPLFSIYTVDVLHFSDQVISFGTAMFNVSLFFGSSQLARLTYRIGNRKLLGYGIVVLSAFPALIALSRYPSIYIFSNLLSGLGWAMFSGAIFNYLLEMAPEHDRPAHMAWYNLAFNGAMLIGSLCGPLIAGWTSIVVALFAFAVLRLLSGLAILKWG
jgi:MFS family permease